MIWRRQPLHVCHFVSGDTWGGLEVMVLNLLGAQQADPAYQVSLIVLNDGRLYQEALARGISAHLLPEGELSGWALMVGLRRALTSLKVELLHTHRYKENLLSYLLARRLGIRSVVTLHGYGPSSFTPSGIKNYLRDAISFALAERARTQFVAVSRDLQRLYRPNDQRCVTIPNGVATPVALGVRRDNAEVSPVIGWVGRLVPVKSLATLLDAVSRVRSSRGEPNILLVGDGTERGALAEQARNMGMQSRVQFTGFVDDPSPYYDRMDVFALPSRHEGMPMAVLEAMAAGVPCVVARVGGIPDMIGDSGAACLVDGHDPIVWARAIAGVLEDPASTTAMIRRAHELVSRRYSIDAMHARYGELYHTIVAR